MIVSGHQQPIFLVTHNPSNSARASRNDRQPGRKRLKNRPGHVVDVRAIQINVSFIVQLIYSVRRDASAEFDVLKPQPAGERFESRTFTAVSRNDQLCLWKLL